MIDVWRNEREEREHIMQRLNEEMNKRTSDERLRFKETDIERQSGKKRKEYAFYCCYYYYSSAVHRTINIWSDEWPCLLVLIICQWA